MSGSSFHYSPNPSHSQKPPPANHQGSAGAIPSHYLISSVHSARPQVVYPTTGTSQPSVRGDPIDPQNSKGFLSVDDDRVIGDFTQQNPRALQRANLPGTIQSNLGQLSRSHHTQQPHRPEFPSPPSAHQPPLPQHSLYSSMSSVQQSLGSPPSNLPSSYLPQAQHGPGMFNQAHNFSVTGNLVDGNLIVNKINPSSNNFMEKLYQTTIQGAAADSAVRYPPPRCQDGTRETILRRCIYFVTVTSSDGTKKMRWVVGAAGVGKSAIMQNIAELDLGLLSCVSVFFSANGRNDGGKFVITLAYQLAAKCKPYRQFIEAEVARDHSLLMSSISTQFNKLIIEPFIRHPLLSSAGRVLIIIDGLDECDDPRTQLQILRLISDLCIMYPSSPIAWFIASRPEPHIVSFFSRHDVIAAYEKEEILVDSDEARKDVERFLRRELGEIKSGSGLFDLDLDWPEERDFWKLAYASGGLFAYADAVIKYIGDLILGNPASQLSDVLNVIDEHPMHGLSREKHPMALLDALYRRILSNIPTGIRSTTRKLLLALASNWDQPLFYGRGSFLVLCNWLGVTPDEAYVAINHLRSVLRVPERDKAHLEKIEPFHKSFVDCISDFSRSNFSRNIRAEVRQLEIQCTLRIIREAPDGIDFGNMHYESFFGVLARGPGTGDRIMLTWKAHRAVGWDDNKTRLIMYQLAIGHIIFGIVYRERDFRNERYIRLLAAQFGSYTFNFPYDNFRDLAFDESRRHEFMSRGILKQMPLRSIILSGVDEVIKLRFRRPSTTMRNQAEPFDPSCKHERRGKTEAHNDQDWTTQFLMVDCVFCAQRFRRHVNGWKTRFPEHACLVLVTSTGKCCVELKFIDSTDGSRSEWTYWFWCEFPPDLR